MRNQRLDTIIVIALPVAVTLGWCSLVWNEPPDAAKKDYKNPNPAVDDPGLFLAPKATVVIVPPSPSSVPSSHPSSSKLSMKKVKPEPSPTDWIEDPLDELIGSCGKRHCDCSDTYESCTSDYDCCNGYDTCINYKCERYEDY